MVDVSLDADVTLDGIAHKADYYGDSGSAHVLDGDWNNHYMWVPTHHTGRLSLRVYLTVDSADFHAVELVDAKEIVGAATTEH